MSFVTRRGLIGEVGDGGEAKYADIDAASRVV